METETKEVLKKIFNKKEIKSRLPFALLAGFTFSFMFFFFGVLEIYAANRDEFMFSVSDFIWPITGIAFAVAAVLSALILFLPKTASKIVFGLVVWVTFMGYIQVLLLNGSGSLMGDTGQKQSTALIVIDTVIWAVTGIAIIAGTMMMESKEWLKRVYLIGIIVIFVMQAAGCVSQIGNIKGDRTDKTSDTQTEAVTTAEVTTAEVTTAEVTTSEATEAEAVVTTEEVTEAEVEITTEEVTEAEAEITAAEAAKTEAEVTTAEVTTEEITKTAKEETTAAVTEKETTKETSAESSSVKDDKNAYLTVKGLDKVSKGKNVVVFIIDRFDVSFFQDITKKEPDYFDKLDGFTYFSDNISLYSRTWPAVTGMITGIENDFSLKRSEYFSKAYTESQFLKDLKANNYKIKLYTNKYYAYSEGTPLVDVADNISVAKNYKITDTGALVKKLFKLSAYRYSPNVLKGSINISSASFSTGVVEMEGGSPLYEINDPIICGQILTNGLSFDGDGNSYIFLHLNGCHTPSNMDADANPLEVERKDMAGSVEQLRGCMKMIFFYLDEMKRLGVYDDSTIIITGDHPRARNDMIEPTQPRLTALFVKPAGSKGKLAYSKAQVSQENLIPTIVKSAGIKTDCNYGLSYFEINENEDRVRYHRFEMSGKPNKIVIYKVTGSGTDFNNWELDSYVELPGKFYD